MIRCVLQCNRFAPPPPRAMSRRLTNSRVNSRAQR